MVEEVTIKDAQLTDLGQEGMEAPAPVTNEEKPSWLPEKFNNAEELAKAYGELEKAYSSKEQPQTETPEEAKESAEKQTGLSLDSYYKEFADNGNLTPESYEKLNQSGLSKELVDSYIEGQQAVADLSVSSVYNSVGGEEKYNQIVNWATESLSETEIKTFNNIIENGTPDEAKFSIKSLESRYQLSTGVEPNLVQGNKPSIASDTFRSSAQVLEAMNDKRYGTDPAFRDEVARRIKNSNVL